MPRYLTAQAYRYAYEGIVEPASPGVSDLALASLISRAEAAIDAYVGMPLLTNNGFAPGILGMVQQGFDMTGGFGSRKLRFPSPLVPVRNIQRIQIHISNASPSGQPLVAILSPGEVVINNWDGYCECIALTLTYSLSAVVWELGTNPPIAEWDLECGFWFPYSGDTLYDTGDGKTFRALRGFWAQTYTQASSDRPQTLPPVPPVVYVNGVPQASATLSAALTAGTAYTSLPVSALTQQIANGTVLVVNDGMGGTGVTVTLAAQANAGATSLTIASWTPAVSYASGTVLAVGYSANYNDGSVVFTASQAGKAVTADYTSTIPEVVREATIAQTTYLLQQRALNLAEVGGLEQVRNGQREVRRARSDDVEEDQLCARARLKLAGYRSIAIA